MSEEHALRWSLVAHTGLSGPENMAWDHTLAEACERGTAVLRFYDWSPATLSLGRNEPARGVYSAEALRRHGVDVVRRPTGGRAVLHDRELTYSVCAPLRSLGGVRAAYATLNRALAAGLRRLGAPVGLATSGAATPLDTGPCFQDPAAGEVMAGDRKLVGSAQVRMGGVLLQHGSILLEDDQVRIAGLTSQGAPDTGRRPAVLREILGREVARGELTRALVEAFAEMVPGDWRGPTGEDRLGADALPTSPRADLLQHYSSAEWTWRR